MDRRLRNAIKGSLGLKIRGIEPEDLPKLRTGLAGFAQAAQNPSATDEDLDIGWLKRPCVIENLQSVVPFLLPEQNVGKPDKDVRVVRRSLPYETGFRFRLGPLAPPGEQPGTPAMSFLI